MPEDLATMAELAYGWRRSKIPGLEQALAELVRDCQWQLLALPLAHSDFLEDHIATLSVAMTRGLIDLGAGEPPRP